MVSFGFDIAFPGIKCVVTLEKGKNSESTIETEENIPGI